MLVWRFSNRQVSKAISLNTFDKVSIEIFFAKFGLCVKICRLFDQIFISYFDGKYRSATASPVIKKLMIHSLQEGATIFFVSYSTQSKFDLLKRRRKNWNIVILLKQTLKYMANLYNYCWVRYDFWRIWRTVYRCIERRLKILILRIDSLKRSRINFNIVYRVFVTDSFFLKKLRFLRIQLGSNK